MGRRKLFTGIIVGAVVGGLTSLVDREVREYTKKKCSSFKETSGYYIKHPSEAVRKARVRFDEVNQTVSKGVTNTINALEQVEEALDSVTNSSKMEK
ncbi:MAG TPA: YtxH domain-containing protein [Bacillota bacterium]|nr:YtxH domain-containing protein [Bacillota bacterium]